MRPRHRRRMEGAHHPSGIALLQRTISGWSCLGVAPSYDSFLAQVAGQAWDPEQKATGSRPDAAALLQAAKLSASSPAYCVSIDMPLVSTSITGRRTAETSITRRFGTRGCALHSPTAEGPGTITDQLRVKILAFGFGLQAYGSEQSWPALIECSPQFALLTLLNCDYRVA